MSLNPARQTRQKRLSREDTDQEEDSILPTSREVATYLLDHRTTMVAAFVTSFVYFSNVIYPLANTGPQGMLVESPKVSPRPAPPSSVYQAAGSFMATGNLWPNDLQMKDAEPVPCAEGEAKTLLPFVLTCAVVHTIVVAFGLALGRDTLTMRAGGAAALIMRVGVASFFFLCAVLYWAWEYQIGPVPAVGERLFSSEHLFILVGALHTTAWLTCSMALPHSPLGHVCTSSSKMHLGIAMMGAAVHASALSVGSSCAVMGVLGATGLLAAEVVKASRCSPFLARSM